MRPAWVFDVDGCLIDLITGSSLRPLATDLFEALREGGIDIILWSAGGADYAARRARQLEFDGWVAGYHGKSERDAAGRWRVDAVYGAHDVRIFVDDAPEELPSGAPVIAVRPYIAGSPHDRGLAAAVSSARAGCCPS